MENFEGLLLLVLLLLLAAYWLTPFLLIILGVVRMKSRPDNAKKLFLISVVMLLVGIGFCGVLLSP